MGMQKKIIEAAREKLYAIGFRQQDDYLLAKGVSLMSEDSHQILHVDNIAAIADAIIAALREQEPVSYRYKFISPMDGETPVWRDSPDTWNGQYPQESCPLYALPIPPVEQAAPTDDARPDYSDMSREALERHASRMVQTLANSKAEAFYRKYADGPMMAPSCLCCGNVTLFGQVAIKHAELPGIVICTKCRGAAAQPAAEQARDAEVAAKDARIVGLECNIGTYRSILDEKNNDIAALTKRKDEAEYESASWKRQLDMLREEHAAHTARVKAEALHNFAEDYGGGKYGLMNCFDALKQYADQIAKEAQS